MNELDRYYLETLTELLKGDLENALELRGEASGLEGEGYSFSEECGVRYPYISKAVDTLLGSYDFTRCVRPDGSVYGTRGKCKKGTETSARAKASDENKAMSQLSKMLPKGEVIVGKGGKEVVATGKTEARVPRKGRPGKTGKKLSEMSSAERREALIKRAKEETTKLRKMPPMELRNLWTQEYNNGRMPRKFPSSLAMAQDVAKSRITKDLELVRKRESQEKGPMSVQQRKLASELWDRGSKEKDTQMWILAGKMLEGNKERAAAERKSAQQRDAKLQKAGAILFNIEKDLKSKSNKMDLGYAPNDQKVKDRLSKIQQAAEKVKKLRDKNINVLTEIEKPYKQSLKSKEDQLEQLSSAIRASKKDKVSANDMKKVESIVKEIQKDRKFLDMGPSFSPDLGGKAGSPLDVRQMYEKA